MRSPNPRQRFWLTSLALCSIFTALAATFSEALALPLQFAIAGSGALLALCALWQIFQPNKTGLFNLDHFLPFLRKRLSDGSETSRRWYHAGMTNLPIIQIESDRQKGKPGHVRRLLRKLGPSAEYAPLRRISQTICFALFLFSFFYICWPYHAKPASPPSIHSGLKLIQFQADTGEIQLKSDTAFEPETDWYLVDQSGAEPLTSASTIGQFRVTEYQGSDLTLHPTPTEDAIQWDLLFISTGPFALSDGPIVDWPDHHTSNLQAKETFEAELFLMIDPLVSLSTAIASRSWVWSLTSAAAILLACIFIPRGFCGYICPLGTLIDLFDTLVGKRVKKPALPENGWWVHLKYYILFAVMFSGLCGVLISGYFAAIPVLTRGFLFVAEPAQTALMRGTHAVSPINSGHVLSIVLFVGVLGLGLLKPRFWCKYVCPSGAVFSLANVFRATQRHVESSCIHCNKCIEVCPFDAIKPDFTTRTADCTLCQTCGGVCPTEAIKFVERWNHTELKLANDPPTNEHRLGRRGFLSLATGTAAAVAGSGVAVAAYQSSDSPSTLPLVRPPGSVPEADFLDMCIRCGECFKACPNNVLQSVGFSHGWKALWTPKVEADWAGCDSSCNACGQVCPTGAIRALPLEEKRHARMGLAIVNQETCLPIADRQDCQLCVDECITAGYNAIEFIAVHTKTDEESNPIEGSGRLAPAVLPELCVGCGLCQTRCHNVLVKEEGLLKNSAIIIHAGEEYEDRKHTGSYLPVIQPTASPAPLQPEFNDSENPF